MIKGTQPNTFRPYYYIQHRVVLGQLSKELPTMYYYSSIGEQG